MSSTSLKNFISCLMTWFQFSLVLFYPFLQFDRLIILFLCIHALWSNYLSLVSLSLSSIGATPTFALMISFLVLSNLNEKSYSIHKWISPNKSIFVYVKLTVDVLVIAFEHVALLWSLIAFFNINVSFPNEQVCNWHDILHLKGIYVIVELQRILLLTHFLIKNKT